MDIDSLATKLAPKIKAALESHETSILDSGKNVFERAAIRLVFPRFLGAVPALTKDAITLISDEFGLMNVNDLLEFLDDHARARNFRKY